MSMTFKTCWCHVRPDVWSPPVDVDATSAFQAARATIQQWPEPERKELVRVYMFSADLGHEGEPLGWYAFEVAKCADGRVLVGYHSAGKGTPR